MTAAAARSVRAAFCLRWGDARLLFWRIRSHQLFGRNVNLMLQSVYFLVCSSESQGSRLIACLVSYRPLGWEPCGFSKRAMRSFQPPRRRLCSFPTPRPGPRPRRRRASRTRTVGWIPSRHEIKPAQVCEACDKNKHLKIPGSLSTLALTATAPRRALPRERGRGPEAETGEVPRVQPPENKSGEGANNSNTAKKCWSS